MISVEESRDALNKIEDWLAAPARTNHAFDFFTLPGDTLKEKYEKFLYELLGIFIKMKHASCAEKSNYWVYGSRETTALLEMCSLGFDPSNHLLDNSTRFAGINSINFPLHMNIWVFSSTRFNASELSVGVSDWYERVKLNNFIF
jgi:hypothetical protein